MLNKASVMKTVATVTLVFGITACTDYDPVSSDRCNEVVRYATKVLGSLAPDSATMMKQCQAASDSERGCVMAATKKGQLAQCM